MKRSKLSLTLAAVVLANLPNAAIADDCSPADRYEHAQVRTMSADVVIEDAVVIVRDGLFAFVGPASDAPEAGACENIFDLTGKFVVPGLVDMHTHVWHGEERSDIAAQEELFLFVANGVTSVRNVTGSAWHLQIRDRVNSGAIIGPRMVTAGPVLEQEHSAGNPFTFTEISNPTEASAEVNAQVSAGYDFVKVYDMVPSHLVQAISSAAADHGVAVSVAAQPSEDRDAFLRQGMTIEHYRGYNIDLQTGLGVTERRPPYWGWSEHVTTAVMQDWVERTLDFGVGNVPTLVALEMLTDPAAYAPIGPDYPYIPAHLKDEVENSYLAQSMPEAARASIAAAFPKLQKFTRMLNDAGAPILTGASVGVPGVSLHRELELLRASGLSNLDVLRAATASSGAAISSYPSQAAPVGRIEVGYAADFIVLNSDPVVTLESLTDIAGVSAGGRFLDQERISEGLEAIRERANESS